MQTVTSKAAVLAHNASAAIDRVIIVVIRTRNIGAAATQMRQFVPARGQLPTRLPRKGQESMAYMQEQAKF